MTLSPVPELCLLLCPSLCLTYTSRTHAHKHTRMHTDCKGSGSPRLKTAGEIRGAGVCVCMCVRGMGGVRACACVGPVLSSLHSSALAQGYVKRRTCCCGSRQNPPEGCTSVSRAPRHACSAGSCERFGSGDPKMNPTYRLATLK